MKVADLMEILSKCNPEATALVYAEESNIVGKIEGVRLNWQHTVDLKVEGETVSLVCYK